MLLSGLVFFGDAGNAFARSACDNWLHADTRIRVLEHARERLWEGEGELNRKVDGVRAHGDPGYDQEIANLKIESITVDTSQAEKIENMFGVEIKGTTMLVRTNGRALLFHETAKGWKLFTIAPPEYFR